MKKFAQFEQFVQRIHCLIEGSDASVEWNSKIIDPDSTNQKRQIDVIIRKNNKLTLVECRNRIRKQDVQWIEELIGRKISLGADFIIAVSSSGFTNGAIAKAKKHSILLRDFKELTDEEILSWGRFTPAYITFYQYKDVEITINYDIEDIESTKFILQDEYQAPLMRALNRTKMELDKVEFNEADFSAVNMVIKPDSEVIAGIKVLEIIINAKVRLLKYNLDFPNVLAYAAPDIAAEERKVKIEKPGDYGFEVIHHSSKLQVWMDFAGIEYPVNSQFQFLYFYVDGPHTLVVPQLGKQVEMSTHMDGIKLSVGYIGHE